MLENLERDYHFICYGCAFYSRPDEVRAINFCKPNVNMHLVKFGFDALSQIQQKIRDKETLRRQKNRERKIRARFAGLGALPHDLESWLQ